MIGLNNVDNTSDLNKPLSSAQKLYIDSSISGLINLAPTTLDSLSELATALGNDPNFSSSITTLIGTKANKDNELLKTPTISGCIFTGTISG